jgi:hypothetical protein
MKWLSRTLVYSAVCVGFIVGGRSDAATGLALICTDATKDGQALETCKRGAMKYTIPTANDLVRDCGIDACWTPGDVWHKFSVVPTGNNYDTCSTDLPDPTIWDADKDDPCKAWQVKVKSFVAVVNTTGVINLSWTAPTQNTDNSPLTNLAGYWIYSGATGSPLTRLKQLGKDVTSYTATGYKTGDYSFTITALNTTGAESAQSSQAYVTVKIPVVPTVPNPPTNLKTVTEQLAYRVDLETTQDTPRMFVIGKVAAGVSCSTQTFNSYNRINASAVVLNSGVKRPKNAFTKCG